MEQEKKQVCLYRCNMKKKEMLKQMFNLSKFVTGKFFSSITQIKQMYI
jgi:hypothetical protein